MIARRSRVAAVARVSARRPKLTISLCLLGLLAAGFAVSRYLDDALTTTAALQNKPDAKLAQDLMDARLPGAKQAVEVVLVRSSTATVDQPAFQSLVQAMEADIARLGPMVVEQVVSYYDTRAPSMVSRDRRAVLMQIVMTAPAQEASDDVQPIHALTIERDVPAGFEVYEAGDGTIAEDWMKLAERDAAKGEQLGLPIAIAVLLVVFGAVVAALLPIVLALVAIVIALGLVALVGMQFHFAFFVVNMITMMGLAVGIDYSLFIVSRFREERAAGWEKHEAIERAARTAGRAVFFSGMTVVFALAGMLLIPITVFRSIGAGAIFVVVAAIVASMTVLPAILSLLGDRVNALRLVRRRRSRGPARSGRFWDGLVHGVMRRPAVSALLAGGFLVVAAVPLFSMKTGSSGIETLPRTTVSYKAFQVLSQEFAGGQTSPIKVVIDGRATPEVTQALIRLRTALASDRRFGLGTVDVNPAGDLNVLSIPVRADPSTPLAADAVRDLRAKYVPAAFKDVPVRVLVGGMTAFEVDMSALTHQYTPIVFAFVLGMSFILLLVVFRSLVVPTKAILMNLLSVGAAYGLVTWVNQQGHGASILGFQRVGVIEIWMPLFLFSVLFGLSMDYHVFLLSRIRERYDQTGDNVGAVAFGVRSTARIITGAALIMVAVFGGFASGELVMFQQMGFGLAIAVLLDATIVRMVLVPSTMRLLGPWNWYLPGWLRWIPAVNVEGGEEPPAGTGTPPRQPELVGPMTRV